MSWMLFGQSVLLIVIFAMVMTITRCVHDCNCTRCRNARGMCGDSTHKEEEKL